ncbi:MAG: sodium-dependent transporter, partial [Candidatus Contubernalis sp.]|nr:sodium-dependent transporter [Candidatus Contubernalis sp.]
MWRFPTMVARGGGGAFVLLFLIVVIIIGVPLIMAELTLGRKSQRNIISTFSILAPGSKWWMVGLLGILGVFLILSFYSVIAGWSIIYFLGSIFGVFSPLDTEGLTQVYSQIAGHAFLPVLGQGMFLVVTVYIVISGVTRGIERWSKVLMPGILIILLVLLGRTLLLEGAVQGVLWFLRPNLELVNFKTALDAVGQVFFSFSLGMGAVLTYGSYLSSRENIPRNALLIGLADVAIAILAGLIVIPALFVFNIEPEIGAGIVFVTLPAIFNTLPGSVIWSSLFFLMLSFAALTSSVSLLEVSVAYLVDEKRWNRATAAIRLGIVTFLAGVPSALSQGVLADRLLLGRNFLDFIDFITSSIFLPLGGLLTVIFLAWIWGTENALIEIQKGSPGFAWGKPWA